METRGPESIDSIEPPIKHTNNKQFISMSQIGQSDQAFLGAH